MPPWFHVCYFVCHISGLVYIITGPTGPRISFQSHSVIPVGIDETCNRNKFAIRARYIFFFLFFFSADIFSMFCLLVFKTSDSHSVTAPEPLPPLPVT